MVNSCHGLVLCSAVLSKPASCCLPGPFSKGKPLKEQGAVHRGWVSASPAQPSPRGHPPPQVVAKARSHVIGTRELLARRNTGFSFLFRFPILLHFTPDFTPFHSWSEARTSAQLGHSEGLAAHLSDALLLTKHDQPSKRISGPCSRREESGEALYYHGFHELAF